MTGREADPATGGSGNDDVIPAPPAEIRSALVAGVARRRRRTRARAALAVGVAAVVGVAGLAGGLLSQGPSPALASALKINPDGGWIEVEIVSADATQGQMTQELHAAGIDAEVRVMPTVRSKIDEWMGLQKVESGIPSQTENPRVAPRPAEIWNADDIAADGDLLRIRREALGRLDGARWVFYVGREPKAHEPRQVLFDDGPREVGSRWRRHLEELQER